MQIEIKGQLYESREEPEKKKSIGKRGLTTLLATYANYALAGAMGGSSYNRQRPKVNIIEEYEKILEKKSTLSKNDRDWVEWGFNQSFKKIEK